MFVSQPVGAVYIDTSRAFCVLTAFLVFASISSCLAGILRPYGSFESSLPGREEDSGEPLFLTPLLKDNKIAEGENSCNVVIDVLLNSKR